jgi:hypothetical protein
LCQQNLGYERSKGAHFNNYLLTQTNLNHTSKGATTFHLNVMTCQIFHSILGGCITFVRFPPDSGGHLPIFLHVSELVVQILYWPLILDAPTYNSQFWFVSYCQ